MLNYAFESSGSIIHYETEFELFGPAQYLHEINLGSHHVQNHNIHFSIIIIINVSIFSYCTSFGIKAQNFLGIIFTWASLVSDAQLVQMTQPLDCRKFILTSEKFDGRLI